MNGRTPRSIQFDTVADIYDTYVRTDFDISFWLSEARPVKGKVLELTCGTGRVSVPLLKAGVELSCVDYAPEMLARLRKKVEESRLSCPLICQDIADLTLPDRFDLIFIPFHSFSELVQEEKRRSALARIRDHLTESGCFIVTLQNIPVRTISMDGSMRLVGDFPMNNGEILSVKSRLEYDPVTQLGTGVQVYDHLGFDGRLLARRTLEMCFYLYRKQEFEALAHESGFEITALYGDYEHRPYDEQSSPFMIWKLRR